MVTESQARQSDPIVARIDSLNKLIAQINQASAEGGWTCQMCIMLSNAGSPENLDISALPGPDLLNDLFQLAHNALVQAQQDLAAI